MGSKKPLAGVGSGSVDLGDGLIVRYTQIPRRRQKNLYLRVEGDGTLRISTPWHYSIKRVESFILQKRDWIAEHLQRQSTLGRKNPTLWHSACRLWYLGKSYPVEKRAAKRNGLILSGEGFLFQCADEEAFERVQHAWYKKAAQTHISQRVAYWSETMGLVPKTVSYRRYKSRWGCCSVHNDITFNTALMRYDDELIDYVVVHELAHIAHKNHGTSFWSLVEAYIPDWRERRKRLV